MSFKTVKPTDPGIDRRTFMGKSACAAMGVTGIVNSLAHLRLMNAAMAASGPIDDNDYKALVVVFLFGGNDSNNMLIPTSAHPSRTDYDSGRGVLAIPDAQLNKLDYPSAGNQQYGLNPFFEVNPATTHPGMQALFNTGKMGFVANVGTLVEPITHRDQVINKTVALPPQLYSHSDQQVQMQSSVPDKAYQTGWGGRAADILNASYNGSGQVSMNISLNGVNKMQVGSAGGGISQYVVTSTGARSLRGYGTNYANAWDGSNYVDSDAGRRLRGFENVMKYTHENLLEQGYNSVVERARNNESFVGEAIDAAENSGVNFTNIFANANNDLGNELEMVAKLIAGRSCFGNQRQIFFVSTGGWDNHQSQLTAHNNKLADLAEALGGFQKAVTDLGVADKVLTVSQSDFTRTFTPNREDPLLAGSDHGYGGHQIVMGEPVQGGQIYGEFPSLKVGTDLDTSSERGRWYPTTATDQYLAVAADWFGISRYSSEMEAIFPNLGRFDDPFAGGSGLLYV